MARVSSAYGVGRVNGVKDSVGASKLNSGYSRGRYNSMSSWNLKQLVLNYRIKHTAYLRSDIQIGTE